VVAVELLLHFHHLVLIQSMVWINNFKLLNSFSDSVRRKSSVLQWNPDMSTQLIVASDDDSSPSLRVIYLFSFLLHPQRKMYLTYLLHVKLSYIQIDKFVALFLFGLKLSFRYFQEKGGNRVVFPQVHITNFIILSILFIYINIIAHISQVWDVRKTISPVREFVGHSKGFISPFVHGFLTSLLMYTNCLYFFLILPVFFASTRCNCYVLVPL